MMQRKTPLKIFSGVVDKLFVYTAFISRLYLLAADYLTVPVMLNFNFTPDRRRGFGFSAGVSAGYLYSSRQKIKQDGDVDKTKANFDLRKWKLSYVGELSLGVVQLYGSYATKSMFEKGLDMTPYNVGFRISSW